MVLVTGGTGLVGIHLLMELSKLSGSEIVAIYRSEESLKHALKVFLQDITQEKWDAIKWVQADITDVPSLGNVFNSYSITQVYHCAGYVTFQASAFEQLKKVNIEGTANMVNFSIDYKIQKFCYVNSISTLNLNPGDEVLNEASKWNPEQDNSGYAISKFGGEMEVWRGSEEGLSIIIVHPGVIIGRGYETGSSEIFGKVKKGLAFFTSGSSGYVSAFDVAKSMVKLMKSEIRNDNFVLVSQNLTHKNIIDTIANTLGVKEPKYKISKPVVTIIAKIEGWLDVFLGRKPIIAKDMVDSLFSNVKYSSKKLQKSLGFTFQSMDKVITEVAKTKI